MLREQTQKSLKDMRLHGMASSYDNQGADPSIENLSFDERLGLLVDAEVHDRRQRKQARLTRAAKLKVNSACIENIKYTSNRNLPRKLIASLASCNWLDSFQHVAITGPTGVGKTWIACALANQAIRKEYSVLYRRLPRLLEELEIARCDGSLPKLRTKLSKIKLLILDDWGVATIGSQNRHDLLELVEDKTGAGSILITSQLPVDKWHDYLGEPTIADAILDRIVHRAHRIELKGDSLRKLEDSDENAK